MRKLLVHAFLVLVMLAGAQGAILPASGNRMGEQPPPTATVRVVSAGSDGITLEMIVPGVATEPVTRAGQRYEALDVPGCTPATEPGHPALPGQAVLLGVPPGADLHLTAEALEAETLPGVYRVVPAPRWVVRQEGEVQRLEPVYEPDTAAPVWTGDAPYPAEPARIVQAGYVRSQRVVRLELTPFQYRPARGELRLIRRLRVRLGFSYPDAAAQSRGAAHPEEPSFEGILSRTLLNYDTARSWRTSPLPPGPPPLPEPGRGGGMGGEKGWIPPSPAWKVSVNRTGLYRLTYADLQAAGLPVDALDPRTFRLYNQGSEVAIHVPGQEDGHFDAGDTLEFYGQALDTRYTDTNVYWLTYGITNGLRMAERDGTPTGAPMPTSFTATARIEENRSYWPSVPTGDDHWFWKYMSAVSPTHSVTQPLTATFTGTIGLVATDTLNAAVNPDHHARVYLNDHWIADAWWDGQTPYSAMVAVPQSYLLAITNTFRVDMPADTGAVYDGVYVNGFTVAYGHPYHALGDELAFVQDAAGAWQYRVTGFSDPDILVLDVTDPAHVVRITGGVPWDGYRLFLPLVIKDYSATGAAATVAPSVGHATHFLRFQDAVAGPTAYLALAASQAHQPLAIVPDVPSHLADPTNQANYVIIACDDLYASTLPLAAYWQSQGMMVQVVRLSDVYDEFSYGILDLAAIRDFLAYAYAHWQPPQLAYVLLVGDGTYDYRNYQGFAPPPGLPPYLVTTPIFGETGSDNWYACVSGDDYLPDLHIGRLPAANAAQVSVMVSKILSYATSPPAGTWNQQVLFVADNADDAGNFPALSEDLVNNYLPPAYTPHKVYYGTPPYTTQPSATLAITSTVNDGCLLVNYIGHGAVYLWAHEKLLYCKDPRCDLNSMVNGGKLPFVASMTCMDGYYIHPDPAFTSLAERWLRRDGGGAVANWAATGMGHHIMNQRLFTAIFTDTLALGPATTESKLALGSSYRDLVETYHLFGDPALTLYRP